MSCRENQVIPYPDSNYVNLENSTIFNLTSWIGNDEQSFFKNFVRIIPNKALVADFVQFEFVYPEERDNLFSYGIAEYSLVNQSNSLLKYQLTHGGNYTIQLQVSSQKLPSFISRTTVNVEYRIISSELLDIAPSVIRSNGTKNNTIQAIGKIVGGGSEIDIYWKLILGFDNSLQKIQS